MIERTGTVRFIDLEGGFYGLVADDGSRYEPQNLGPAFRMDGLRVRFKARLLRDGVTIYQWGAPVELLEIARGY